MQDIFLDWLALFVNELFTLLKSAREVGHTNEKRRRSAALKAALRQTGYAKLRD
jgi:hypothetical protein